MQSHHDEQAQVRQRLHNEISSVHRISIHITERTAGTSVGGVKQERSRSLSETEVTELLAVSPVSE
jgi:hypothetical protein